MGTLVSYATDKGVAVLTLHDSPVNAFTHEMLKELDTGILEARFDDDVHVLVVTGHGEGHFSAGVNVNMLKEAGATFKYYFYLHAAETLQRLESTPKLVIAAINGNCVGGGFELALACDLRIARGGSFRIGLTDVNVGLLPGMGGMQRLSRVVGTGAAMELLLEGQRLSVDQAHTAGLLHKVWPSEANDDFMREVLDYAHGFCPPHGAALAVGLIKRAAQSEGRSAAALEHELGQRLLSSHDGKEGLLAFMQKRKAVFRAE